MADDNSERPSFSKILSTIGGALTKTGAGLNSQPQQPPQNVSVPSTVPSLPAQNPPPMAGSAHSIDEARSQDKSRMKLRYGL